LGVKTTVSEFASGGLVQKAILVSQLCGKPAAVTMLTPQEHSGGLTLIVGTQKWGFLQSTEAIPCRHDFK
jgi:hypothetical protein